MASSSSTGFFSTCLFFFLLFLGERCSAAATTPVGNKPKGVIVPVVKDAATNQYVATLQQRTPLKSVRVVVNLGSGFLWVNCEVGYTSTTRRPVPCSSPICPDLFGCAGFCTPARAPQCNNTCIGTPWNPIVGISTSGELYDDVLVVRSTTDGKTAGPPATVPHFVFVCGASLLLPGLAAGSEGMLGLGRLGFSPPNQLANAFNLKKKFALCLSPSSAGAIVFGDGPLYLGIDLSKSLAYTKLLVNPVSTAGSYSLGERSTDYFVKLTSIAVNGKAVPLNTTLLDIHQSVGGTKFSTVVPYTTLEGSIYKAVESAFVREATASGMKMVAAVKPFGACFRVAGVAKTRVGWAVPPVELFFEGASFGWKILGANSMVSVGGGDVICLGLVDGGATPRTSIVIGGLQLEDHLLQFDLESNKMGFSNTLLSKQTSCASFKFA